MIAPWQLNTSNTKIDSRVLSCSSGIRLRNVSPATFPPKNYKWFSIKIKNYIIFLKLGACRSIFIHALLIQIIIYQLNLFFIIIHFIIPIKFLIVVLIKYKNHNIFYDNILHNLCLLFECESGIYHFHYFIIFIFGGNVRTPLRLWVSRRIGYIIIIFILLRVY